MTSHTLQSLIYYECDTPMRLDLQLRLIVKELLHRSCRPEPGKTRTEHPFIPRRSILDSPDTELGGARRDRTADPLLAKQVLSQLSYGPLEFGGSGWI